MSLAFAAGGSWQVREGNAAGWFVMVFFGLSIMVFPLHLLARGNHLRLDQDGFTVAMVPVSRCYRWSEVDRFFVSDSSGPALVVFDLPPACGRRSLNQRLTKRFLGYDDALPQTYGMAPDRLAELMNGWKTRATGVAPSTPVAAVVVDQDGVRRRLPNGRQEAVRWADLVEVAICTTPHGPWREDVFFLLVGRGGSGCAVPHGEAVDRDLLRWLQALPGFDDEKVCDAMGCIDDALFVCWHRSNSDHTSDPRPWPPPQHTGPAGPSRRD